MDENHGQNIKREMQRLSNPRYNVDESEEEQFMRGGPNSMDQGATWDHELCQPTFGSGQHNPEGLDGGFSPHNYHSGRINTFMATEGWPMPSTSSGGHQFLGEEISEETPGERKKRKNREAAARCQRRRKQRMEQLRKDVTYLREAVENLRNQKAQFDRNSRDFQSTYSQYGNSPTNNIPQHQVTAPPPFMTNTL